MIAALLTGSFVVEYVFAIPGMGRFFITAVTDRDYPLIMGVTLVYTAVLGGRQLPGRSRLRLRRSPNTGVLTMARLNMQPSEGVRNPLVLCNLVFIVFISAAGLLAPWISPYGAGGFEESRILETPSWAHLMGTDGLGRDLLTRVLYGARVSMTVGIGTAMIALVIGTTYGLASGFTGGNLDHLMMRAVDIFYGLPDMLIFILLSLLLGRNIGGLLIALGLVSWVRFARMARGQMLQAKEFLFVEGARAMGASRRRIVLRHILPNILGPIIVTLTFSIPAAILAESTLSFIGLGINDPYSAWGTSWGSLAQDGWRAMRTYPHILFFPTAAIFLDNSRVQYPGQRIRRSLESARKVIRLDRDGRGGGVRAPNLDFRVGRF